MYIKCIAEQKYFIKKNAFLTWIWWVWWLPVWIGITPPLWGIWCWWTTVRQSTMLNEIQVEGDSTPSPTLKMELKLCLLGCRTRGSWIIRSRIIRSHRSARTWRSRRSMWARNNTMGPMRNRWTQRIYWTL